MAATVGAAAVVAAAAAGVTSIASVTAAAPQVQPVVFGAPLPQTPAPELRGVLVQTLNGLAGAGSFFGPKGAYIQGGLGRTQALFADRAYNQAAAQGYFPLSFNVTDIDQEGGLATANVNANAHNGESASQSVTFTVGPSPSGWQISQESAVNLLSSVG
jgi:hypothetical protein